MSGLEVRLNLDWRRYFFGMHANGAVAFDPGKFVLQVDDQFIYRDRYAGPSLAIRHYVNPVRQ